MALVQNITRVAGYAPLRTGSYFGATERSQWADRPWAAMSRLLSSTRMDNKAGTPSGYRAPYAWAMPMKPGGCATFKSISGTSTLDLDISNRRFLAATIAGACSVSLDDSAIATLRTTISGSATFEADINGAVYLYADLSGSGDVVSDIVGRMVAGTALAGSSAFSAAVVAPVAISADLAGSGSVDSARLAGAIYLVAALSGSGAVSTADVGGPALLVCSIAIGSQPTAADIASAVWTADQSQYADTEGTMGLALYLAKQLTSGRMRAIGSSLVHYAEDGETVIREFTLLNADGDPAGQAEDVAERVPVE